MKIKIWMCLLLWAGMLSGGCAMQWQASWQPPEEKQIEGDRALNPEQARTLFEEARDKESLLASIAAYTEMDRSAPDDYQILKQLSTQYILLGTAYTSSRREKSKHFRRAMVYAERAMYTNPDFRALADSGLKPWEAADSLSAEEAEAMFFWVTALQYEFKEGMTLPGKIVNLVWLERALVFLDRIEEVAPDFGGGGVEFAKVICYYALPESRGGSKTKGDDYMRQAVARGDDRLLPRWARGKYYYPIKGEDKLARKDLEWVASRNPREFQDVYPWRVHFQDDARQFLR